MGTPARPSTMHMLAWAWTMALTSGLARKMRV